MSIASPARGILNFKTIPVDCSSCEYYGDLSGVSDDTKKALIGATIDNKLNEERKMVIRVRELFNRHANSKHEMVLRCTPRLYSEITKPEPDLEFEKDLDDNPDIAKYMSNRTNLNAREILTKNAGKRLQSFQNRKDIACPKCGSFLVVPNTFYNMVRSYEDDIACERSRNSRFHPTAFGNCKNSKLSTASHSSKTLLKESNKMSIDDQEKFYCGFCAGTGLWSGDDAYKYGKKYCYECKGKGYTTTDNPKRAKMRERTVKMLTLTSTPDTNKS